MTPDSEGGNYAYGDCGDSFIYFNGSGQSQGFVYTGFDIPHPTVEVHWLVAVTDQRGTGVVNTERGATGNKWRTDYYTNNAKGSAFARVETGAFAIMTNGVECFSGGPLDHTVIY